jgi:type IV secretory pathway VirB6-like protein
MNPIEMTTHNFLGTLKDLVYKVAIGEYLNTFAEVAISIVALLLAIELVKAGIKLASGGGVDLWVIGTYLFVALAISQYGTIVDALINSEYLISNDIINTTILYKQDSSDLLGDYITMQQAKEAEEDVSWYDISGHIDKLGVALSFMVVQVFNSITMFIIDFLYASQFFAFMMILMVGPMFIAFGLSEATRSLCMGWIGNVLGYFLIMIFMAVAAKMVYAINIDSIKTMTIEGTPGWAALIPAIGRALIAGGLAIAVPQAGKSLAGIMGGGGGSMMAAMGGGVAMMKGAEAGRQGLKNARESFGAHRQASQMTQAATEMMKSGNVSGAMQLANQASGMSTASRSAGAKKAYMTAAQTITGNAISAQKSGGGGSSATGKPGSGSKDSSSKGQDAGNQAVYGQTSSNDAGASVRKESGESVSGNKESTSRNQEQANQTVGSQPSGSGDTSSKGQEAGSQAVANQASGEGSKNMNMNDSSRSNKESSRAVEQAFNKVLDTIKKETGD